MKNGSQNAWLHISCIPFICMFSYTINILQVNKFNPFLQKMGQKLAQEETVRLEMPIHLSN